ncbi:hypothetical protein B296_00005077, partial [Ensete ventricosum]
KASKAIGEGPESLGVRGIVAKPMSVSGAMEVKAQAQALPKANGTKVGLKTEAQKVEEDSPSAPRTFYNQLPDWSFLFAAITTIFLAAEKQFTLIDWKPRRPDMLADAFGLGKIMPDGLVFRQNFSIREDVVEIDSWVAPSGKNGMRRDWHGRDYRTGKTVLRATRLDDPSFFFFLDLLLCMQSAPISILESHEIAGMTLEYRKECGKDSVLQSLTAVDDDGGGDGSNLEGSPGAGIECRHLLRLECGAEIVRGRTQWRPKRAQGLQTEGPLRAATV